MLGGVMLHDDRLVYGRREGGFRVGERFRRGPFCEEPDKKKNPSGQLGFS